jgi:peptidoglycan biosynthesis protein MviN/MurJ (putative lipid II flippase)
VGVISITIYTIVAIILLEPLGLFSLMVADAIKHMVHTVIMLLIFQRQLGGLGGFGITISLVKSLVATALTGLAAFAVASLLEPILPTQSFLGRLILVVSAGVAGLLAYLAAIFALDIKDAKSILFLVWRRLRKKKHNSN